MTVHNHNDTAHDYGEGFAETTLKLYPTSSPMRRRLPM